MRIGSTVGLLMLLGMPPADDTARKPAEPRRLRSPDRLLPFGAASPAPGFPSLPSVNTRQAPFADTLPDFPDIVDAMESRRKALANFPRSFPDESRFTLRPAFPEPDAPTPRPEAVRTLFEAKKIVPRARVDHYAWCRPQLIVISGWRVVIQSIEPAPRGTLVVVNVTPVLRVPGAIAPWTNDVFQETYGLDRDGQLRFLRGELKPSAWAESYFEF